jgi:hypothetical protein
MDLWELAARDAICDTMAQYNWGGDAGDLDELAAAFCVDGVLEIRGYQTLSGRAAIAQGLRRGLGAGAPERTIVRHNVANIRFESVTGSEARVASYFTVLTDVGLDHYGRYRDTFVPVDDRWLIRHRFVSVDWRADNSLFPPRS